MFSRNLRETTRLNRPVVIDPAHDHIDQPALSISASGTIFCAQRLRKCKVATQMIDDTKFQTLRWQQRVSEQKKIMEWPEPAAGSGRASSVSTATTNPYSFDDDE